MNTQDTFARILASLYDAMLDESRWPATSALIDEACGLTGNGLMVGEGPKNDVRGLFVGLYYRGQRREDLQARPSQATNESGTNDSSRRICVGFASGAAHQGRSRGRDTHVEWSRSSFRRMDSATGKRGAVRTCSIPRPSTRLSKYAP